MRLIQHRSVLHVEGDAGAENSIEGSSEATDNARTGNVYFGFRFLLVLLSRRQVHYKPEERVTLCGGGCIGSSRVRRFGATGACFGGFGEDNAHGINVT